MTMGPVGGYKGQRSGARGPKKPYDPRKLWQDIPRPTSYDILDLQGNPATNDTPANQRIRTGPGADKSIMGPGFFKRLGYDFFEDEPKAGFAHAFGGTSEDLPINQWMMSNAFPRYYTEYLSLLPTNPQLRFMDYIRTKNPTDEYNRLPYATRGMFPNNKAPSMWRLLQRS